MMPFFALPIGSFASTVLYAFNTSDIFGKAVVVLLVAGSVLAWSIMLTKAREFGRARSDARRFLAAYRREGHPLALYVQGRGYPGPVGTVYRLACDAVLKDSGTRIRSAELFVAPGSSGTTIQLSAFELGTARKIAERTVLDNTADLEENMGLLATSVTAAPFLGLLGTVWGVLDAFRSMAQSGSVLLSEVAPGISGALLTTVVGLLVALPSLIGYNLLTNQIRRLAVAMDNFAEEFNHDLERTFLPRQ